MAKGQVLSIQSHVVHGHVGNTAATFPLQLLGYEVDVINSVQFSNHTGYEQFKGQVLEAAELDVLISGLRFNNLLKYTHVLTGYIGSTSFLNRVIDLICELKQQNPQLVYVCDPVMGDNGKMYVTDELLPIYCEKLIKLADVITPNQYEAELILGMSIKSEADAQLAVDRLLSKSVKCVIITSVEFVGREDELVLFAGNNEGERVRLAYPKIQAPFTGTGDLFTAVLLGWSGHGLHVACKKAILTMQAVLTRTLKHALELSGGAKPSPEQIELQLIQSKQDIEHPPSIKEMELQSSSDNMSNGIK